MILYPRGIALSIKFSHFRNLLFILSCFCISGCSVMNLVPPDPTILKLTIVADQAVNPMANQLSAPIQIRLYILRTQSLFTTTDPQTILQKEATLFGSDLLDKRVYVLAPGAKEVAEIKLPPEAYFVGVIGAFREIDFSKGQRLIRIVPQKVNIIQLVAKGNAITVEYPPVKLLELPAGLPAL